MTLHPSVEKLRDWLRDQHRLDGSLESIQVLQGDDAGTEDLAVRLHVANRSYYEVRVNEVKKEVQVGFGTEDRNVNEEIEQMVLDNGGDLDELLGDELCDLGEEPLHMEHFWDRPAFRYTVRLRPDSLDELDSEALRKRVSAVLKASHILFQEKVDEA